MIRGDRSIIRNLEKATKKTNNNMAALIKWSVDSARTETGWIADKIDPRRRIHPTHFFLFFGGKIELAFFIKDFLAEEGFQ